VSRSIALSRTDRQALLGLARTAIRDAVAGETGLQELLSKTPPSEPMQVERGVFVTLKAPDTNDRSRRVLRGCIGNVTSSRPLYLNVVETAPKSAVADPRFQPLTVDELPAVTVEISALTPPRELNDPGQIVVGRDGVELRCGSGHAVFLPQVASEQGWDLDRLLEELSVKAGLPAHGWREGVLSAFRVERFAEPGYLLFG